MFKVEQMEPISTIDVIPTMISLYPKHTFEFIGNGLVVFSKTGQDTILVHMETGERCVVRFEAQLHNQIVHPV